MPSVKATLFLVLLIAVVAPLPAHALSQSQTFESVDAFVAAAKAFQPSTARTDLSTLFAAAERGQLEDPKRGTLVTAPSVDSISTLWSDKKSAFVFAIASPPIEFSRCKVGVLFLLQRFDEGWHIADHVRFTAVGKEADISATLSSETGTGYHLGSDGMSPIVTVKEWQGGRGYSYEASASYAYRDSRIKRLDLE